MEEGAQGLSLPSGTSEENGNRHIDAWIRGRTHRLSPQEWRVITLAFENVGPSGALSTLGIAGRTLERHRSSIRRKLAIPPGVRFDEYVRRVFAVEVQSERSAPLAEARANDERRVKWLLRLSLDELRELGASARIRARTIQSPLAAEVDEELVREADDLREVGFAMTELYEATVRAIRARSASIDAGVG